MYSVIKAEEGQCLSPITYLDDDCMGCPWTFTCTINKNGMKQRGAYTAKPVKVSIKPNPNDTIPCFYCGKQKETALVQHRTEWHVCEACLLARTDFTQVVPLLNWKSLRAKVFR